MIGGCDVIDNNFIDKLFINVGIGILSLKCIERKKNKIGGNICLVVVEIDLRFNNIYIVFFVERYYWVFFWWFWCIFIDVNVCK